MDKPVLVVLGCGFASFTVVNEINTDLYDIIVISPRNHFLFTPLLPSTAVGTIEFRSIIESIRIARPGVTFYQAECKSIDFSAQKIQCQHALDRTQFDVRYDMLVLGVGATNNTYGIPGVEEHALFLKELSDARTIRHRIIDSFELASVPGLDEAEHRRLLHFVVVGGGPTGVEFAAELHDLLTEDLRNLFPHLIRDARITLLEATDQLLTSFDATLGNYTMKHFKRQEIEVVLGSVVARVDASTLYLKDGRSISYGVLVWSTGIGPTGLVKSMPFEKDRHSRIIVDGLLRVKGYENIYAIGDCATQEGESMPATAQVAQQEGRYLARTLNHLASGTKPKPFHYKNYGMLAYIGSNQALADLSHIKGHGYGTWLFWRSAYFTRLVSLKNKILVLFDWMKTLIFGRDISRF